MIHSRYQESIVCSNFQSSEKYVIASGARQSHPFTNIPFPACGRCSFIFNKDLMTIPNPHAQNRKP